MRTDKPLLSYIVLTFNHHSFVREAIKSALSQTYSPLEIIISDDCSTDGTFDIANEIVSEYRGCHTIRMNRNPVNLGLGGNVNRAAELCRGEFIVVAAGDDISVPTRAAALRDAWEASGRRATSVFSSYTIISVEGAPLGVGGTRDWNDISKPVHPVSEALFTFLSARAPVVNGCTHGFSPELLRYFGPLRSDLEDLVLSFRSLAIGEMSYVNEPLVKYRRHELNLSFLAEHDDTRSFEHRERRLRSVDEMSVIAYDNLLNDIAILEADGRLSPFDSLRLKHEARRIRSHYAVERQMMEGHFAARLRIIVESIMHGNTQAALRALPRTLPRSWYKTLYNIRLHWRARRVPAIPRAS